MKRGIAILFAALLAAAAEHAAGGSEAVEGMVALRHPGISGTPAGPGERIGESNATEPQYRWIEGDHAGRELVRLINSIRNDQTLLCKEELDLESLKEALADMAREPSAIHKDRVERLAERLHRRYSLIRSRGCFAPQEFMSEEEMRFTRPKAAGEGFDHPVLERLREALWRYRAIAAKGGWERIEPKDTAYIRPQKSYPEIPAVKRRLAMEGYYNGPLDQNLTYDKELELAVREFQRRHGLKPDGVIGPRTLRAMNESVESKIRKILLNMERFRWIMGEDDYFVLVNIPGFFLEVYENNDTVFRSKVVVGRKKRPTPIMRHAISYAVLNPYWRAPKTIIKEDILPYLQEGDFERIERKGIVAATDYKGRNIVPLYEVNWSDYTEPDEIPYFFMQTPGSRNVLGRIKLIFPNKFDVYLHDTNNKRVFGYRYRALSSGCIRVEKPLELFHLLKSRESNITRQEIFDIIATNETTKIRFRRKVPIYLAYLTVYVDSGGGVYFYRDLYGYDKRFLPLLQKRALTKVVEVK